MHTAIKESWLESLRSGNFEQGVGVLRSYDNKYCCLGVLLATEDASWYIPENGPDHSPYLATWGDTSDIYDLPEAFRTYVGIETAEMEALVVLNDVDKSSFQQIADYVEKNL